MKNHFKGFGRQLISFSGRQLISFSRRQFIVMLLGNVILALGLAMFNQTGSNHPFHTMLYGAERLLSGVAGGFFSYANLQIMLNIVLVVVEIIFGLQYIGFGAIANMFLLGYMVTGLTWLLNTLHVEAAIDWMQVFAGDFSALTAGALAGHIVLLLLATLVISFGLSLYQAGNMGVAPYDSMPLILADRTKLPFFWCRMICDGLCLVVTFAVAGDFGLGTVITVFCTGPFIRFFDKTLSCKIMANREAA